MYEASFSRFKNKILYIFNGILIIPGSGMSILSHIALRMVTQAGLETSLSIHSKYITNEVKTVEGSALNDIEGVAKKSKMKSRKERLNRSKKGLRTLNEKNSKEEDVSKEEPAKVDDKVSFEESLEMKAAQVYSLCAHSEHRKGEDYLKRIVMGLFLTECLKKAGFFTKCSPENLETGMNLPYLLAIKIYKSVKVVYYVDS